MPGLLGGFGRGIWDLRARGLVARICATRVQGSSKGLKHGGF